MEYLYVDVHYILVMVNRKRSERKNLYLSPAEKQASDELKDNIRLGLIDVPTDHDLYNEGVMSYSRKLEAIKRSTDKREKPIEVHRDYLKNIASDVAQTKFETTYQEAVKRAQGMKVGAQDKFGFPAYKPRSQPGTAHGLDDVYQGADVAPPAGLLAFFSLSVESWASLLESERLELKRIWAEKLLYGNV